jgi:hypothetical protein
LLPSHKTVWSQKQLSQPYNLPEYKPNGVIFTALFLRQKCQNR